MSPYMTYCRGAPEREGEIQGGQQRARRYIRRTYWFLRPPTSRTFMSCIRLTHSLCIAIVRSTQYLTGLHEYSSDIFHHTIYQLSIIIILPVSCRHLDETTINHLNTQTLLANKLLTYHWNRLTFVWCVWPCNSLIDTFRRIWWIIEWNRTSRCTHHGYMDGWMDVS